MYAEFDLHTHETVLSGRKELRKFGEELKVCIILISMFYFNLTSFLSRNMLISLMMKLKEQGMKKKIMKYQIHLLSLGISPKFIFNNIFLMIS
jgi:hypothetical protein